MKKYYSAAMMLLAAAIWGFAFSAQKIAGTLGAFTIGTVRNLFAAIFLLPVIAVIDRLTESGRVLISRKNKCLFGFNKFELIGGVLCGVVLTVASALQQFGINDGTDAGKASFITALYVVIVPIIGIFMGKRSPLNVWVSVGIAVVGFYLLCIKGDFSMEASDISVLLCALVFALHIIVIDRYAPRCDGVRMSCIQFASAMIFNLVLTLIFEAPISFGEIFAGILPLVYLGIGSSGIAYTLQIAAQRHVHPAAGAVILSLESVFGVIGSAILLKEVMTAREYIGCAIVFAAVLLSQVDVISLIRAAIGSKNNTRKNTEKEENIQ